MKNTRTILDELTSASLPCKKELVESRGNHLIVSAINLLKLIQEQYSETAAEEIERRLINSIKARDPEKFTRGVKRLL